jgi:hypothetical protein
MIKFIYFLHLVSSEESSYLRCELERVIRERDNLIAQIKQDSQTLDNKILSIRSQGKFLYL